MAIIYHITNQENWLIAQQNGYYTTTSLLVEGFIHCSKEEQLTGVLDRYYKNEINLVKLIIDTNKLTSKVVLELAPSINEEFPHIYGVINVDAIIEVVKIN